MKKIGISIYPDFDDIETMKSELDYAKSLGYQCVFTSLQLGDLGFKNTSIGVNKEFQFLFDYCDKIGLEIHVDTNDRMLALIGASPDNLKPISDLHIKVLRLDGGFTNQETALMTQNPWHIIIEENASMLQFPKERIETIVKEGNIQQYYACHNYFPLNETGISYADALKSAQLFKQYGVRVGIFIGSLYSSTDLNAVGRGIVTIESHRYIPSHIQAMELFVHDEFDYVIFGDSHPSQEELRSVSEVAKNDDYSLISEMFDVTAIEEDFEPSYCVEIPVWLNKDLPQELRTVLTNTVFLSRADQPSLMIRGTQTRGICSCVPYLPIARNQYSLVLDNCQANRYNGELQIPLIDLPPVDYANVIGQVKPYGYQLLEFIKYAKTMFVLREE